MKFFLKITIIGILSILICINKSYAQIDTSTTQKLLQYIMQPLDKNQIPTGFLEEYGCPMLPMETFNGSLSDSNRIDMHLWRTLYFQLQTGWTRTASNPLPTIITVNSSIKNNSGDTIAIPLLIANYNTVKSNAFTSNLLSYNSSTKQVHDVPARPQSPYDTKNLFAACPNKKQTLTGKETFIVSSNLIWNNTGKTISQLQIDFNNGQGFRTITIGTSISVTYNDTGYKRWTIKATLSDNSVLQCYNDYYVLKASDAQYRFAGNESVIPSWGFVNVNSGATIHINYSEKSYTGTLRKPLIVVEGYDVSHVAPDLQPNYDFSDFIDAINEPRNSYDFNYQLDDVAGYDLVFIDFIDGADDIVDNAAIVQEVINRVNDHKVNDDRFGNIRQQNVVMGLSMGGLCARYALANMTKNFSGTPTETRLLITHDSPHRGANVPLGLQYMIRMMGGVQLFGYNVYDIYADYDEAIALLDAPATEELLYYRATTANAYVSNTFLDATYRPMITFSPSDPQPSYRFIATSLGSECAHPLFNPGKTFVNLGAGVSAGIDARFLFFRVPIVSYKLAAEVEAYALPNTGSTNKIARVYTINNLKLFGFINIFKQLYNNTAFASGTQLAIDGVPGSNYPLLDVQALNQLTTLPTFAANLYVSFPLGPFLSGYFGAYAYNQGVSYNFTFVPTASALDATPYTTPVFSQKYIAGVNPNYPSSSETFIAQETNTSAGTTNNVHIRFTARNSEWLFDQMENIANTLNCSTECSPDLAVSVSSDLICTSATASITGLPASATVSWSATPSGTVSITPNGQQATIAKVSSGYVAINATVNSCNTYSKTVFVGGYGSGDYPISGPSSASCNSYVTYTTVQLPGATNYSWFYPGNWTYVSGQGTYSLTLHTNNTNGNYQVGVRVANACDAGGSAAIKNTFLSGCSGYFYTVSPNPATSTVTVNVAQNSALDNSTNVSKSSKQLSFSTINIYDQTGNLKIHRLYNEVKSASLNVSNLPTGIYIIEITNGTYKETQKLQILKN